MCVTPRHSTHQAFRRCRRWARGHVTFGSFNNPLKITAEVIDVWAEILRSVPNSRLVLKYHGLDTATVSERIAGSFAERGVARTRLDLLGGTSHADLMCQYQRIDIALDPFPYSGGLTTCEALWMGVPVVTCPGETFASRHTLSHLSNVGLTETIAADRNAYVSPGRRSRGRSPPPHHPARRAARTDGGFTTLRRPAVCKEFHATAAGRLESVVRRTS